MMILNHITQKLLFIMGKGGVGRTTVAASLASYFAAKGEKVLVVQWALKDSISPLYSLPECSHTEQLLPGGYKVMNFSSSAAIREYFVDHLKMKFIYSMIIENRQVQKFIHAAPGIQELFFLGRLFWLVELVQKEKGYYYDRVIVDCPATGHGVSLFGIAPAVANLGVTGPLATECQRVTKLLMDKEKTGVFIVTLPEELPVEECYESVPKITEQLQRPPLALIINQSNSTQFFPKLNLSKDEEWFLKLKSSLNHLESRQELDVLLAGLIKRNLLEEKVLTWAQSFSFQSAVNPIRVISLPDVRLLHKVKSPLDIINSLFNYFSLLT